MSSSSAYWLRRVARICIVSMGMGLSLLTLFVRCRPSCGSHRHTSALSMQANSDHSDDVSPPWQAKGQPLLLQGRTALMEMPPSTSTMFCNPLLGPPGRGIKNLEHRAHCWLDLAWIWRVLKKG